MTYVDHELWTRLTMSHLIVGGVFERHPDLKVVWTEMPGLRWAVEDLERMTRQLRIVQSRHAGNPRQLNFSAVFGSPTTDSLSLTPLEYFRRNCYIGGACCRLTRCTGSTSSVPIGSCGATTSRTPRVSLGHTSEALRANFAGFSVDECRDLLGGTAAGVYHFDVDALVPVAERVGPPVELIRTPLTDSPESPGSAFWETVELTELLNHV